MISDSPLRGAIARILRPIVRLLIARNIQFPDLADRLKELYVAVAVADFQLDRKRVTDSRISVLTGLQRKDIRAIREKLEAEPVPVDMGAGILPQVLAHWRSAPSYQDRQGTPRALARAAIQGGPSFDELVSAISRDIHPRTVFDELVRLGLVEHEDDVVRLSSDAFLPRKDDEALLGYFGANLGDHAEAGAANVLASPQSGPFFERAVHYNQLSADSLVELDLLARNLQGQVLAGLNDRALTLQRRDQGKADANARFRCGVFIYQQSENNPGETEQ